MILKRKLKIVHYSTLFQISLYLKQKVNRITIFENLIRITNLVLREVVIIK